MIKNKQTYNKQLIETIIEGMQEVKAHDIVCINLTEIKNSIADYYIICHGTSTTQVEAIAGSIEKQTLMQLKDKPWHIEGQNNSNWILMDYVNVVVHIFNEETRTHYDLENLWADAKIEKIEYQD